MSQWPLEIDGREFKPIPQSWIDARTAYDDDPEAPDGAIRLYAVSVAREGRFLIIRYGHPTGSKVAMKKTSIFSPAEDLIYPYGLRTAGGWPKSIVPREGREPDDDIRKPERDALAELWGDELGLDDDSPGVPA